MIRRPSFRLPVGALVLFLCTGTFASADTCARLKLQTEVSRRAYEQYRTYSNAGRSDEARASYKTFAHQIADASHYIDACDDQAAVRDYYMYDFRRNAGEYFEAPSELKPGLARIGYNELKMLFLAGLPEKWPRTYTTFRTIVQGMYNETNQDFVPFEETLKAVK